MAIWFDNKEQDFKQSEVRNFNIKQTPDNKYTFTPTSHQDQASQEQASQDTNQTQNRSSQNQDWAKPNPKQSPKNQSTRTQERTSRNQAPNRTPGPSQEYLDSLATKYQAMRELPAPPLCRWARESRKPILKIVNRKTAKPYVLMFCIVLIMAAFFYYVISSSSNNIFVLVIFMLFIGPILVLFLWSIIWTLIPIWLFFDGEKLKISRSPFMPTQWKTQFYIRNCDISPLYAHYDIHTRNRNTTTMNPALYHFTIIEKHNVEAGYTLSAYKVCNLIMVSSTQEHWALSQYLKTLMAMSVSSQPNAQSYTNTNNHPN